MQWRRKKKFISAKSQLLFATWLILYSLVFFFLVMLFLFIQPMAGWLNPGIDHVALFANFASLLAAKWPFLLLVVGIMVLLGNLFSIKIFGPEYRFKKILESLINKDLNVFYRLRKYDYHRELEGYFGGLIESLKNSVKGMKKSAEEADTALKSSDTAKAKEALEKLKKELSGYKMD